MVVNVLPSPGAAAKEHRPAPQPLGSTDLQIIIGSGNNYETIESSSQRVTRTVLVGVKNHNRNRYISNCKLYVKLPNEESFRPLNNGSFTLNADEERFFEVAYRHDYAVRTHEIDSIQFSIRGAQHWAYRGTYFITLKAEGFEARTYEVICKLWVDENGILRLDRV